MTALVPQTQAPTYDSAGNMTADHRGYVFGYDHENRLRKVEKAGTLNVLLATFRYDALGQRVEMVDESVTPAVVTRYVYDGDNVVAAYEDVGGTWTRQWYYVHGATYIDVRTDRQIKTVGGFTKEVTGLGYVGLGDDLLACSGDATVRINDRKFPGAADFQYACDVSLDGSIAITGGQAGVLRIFNAADGKLLHALEPTPPKTPRTAP